jgi:hypothetical protein
MENYTVQKKAKEYNEIKNNVIQNGPSSYPAVLVTEQHKLVNFAHKWFVEDF